MCAKSHALCLRRVSMMRVRGWSMMCGRVCVVGGWIDGWVGWLVGADGQPRLGWLMVGCAFDEPRRRTCCRMCVHMSGPRVHDKLHHRLRGCVIMALSTACPVTLKRCVTVEFPGQNRWMIESTEFINGVEFVPLKTKGFGMSFKVPSECLALWIFWLIPRMARRACAT